MLSDGLSPYVQDEQVWNARGLPRPEPGAGRPLPRQERGNLDVQVTRRTYGGAGPFGDKVLAPKGQAILAVALTSNQVCLRHGMNTIFEGVMGPGLAYLCRPAQALSLEAASPAAFLHIQIDAEALGAAFQDDGVELDILDASVPFVVRDASIGHLARAVQAAPDSGDERYVEALAQAITMRTVQTSRRAERASALPKWRLKRVMAFIADHLSEPISLNELAAEAGLSRAHFAAQFRLATGATPHDFVLLQRVELAKRLLLETSRELVDIALSVGFQTQAHFSTVFKRFAGESPGRWRTRGRALSGEVCDPLVQDF